MADGSAQSVQDGPHPSGVEAGDLRRTSRDRTRASRTWALALAGLAASLASCPDGAERPAAAGTGEGGPGRILYLTYCESCHGIAGHGDGPAAAALRTAPPDLTRLYERYGTPLDRDRLAEYIDGKALLGAHGPRQMPIWGNEFFEDLPETAPGLEGAKRQLFAVLVGYLETLQTERQL